MRRAAVGPSQGLLLALLLVLPAQLVFAPLGGAGSPAQMLGVGLLLWWVLVRLVGQRRLPSATPITWAALALLAAGTASYVKASLRPTMAIESSAAQRGMISLAAFVGMAVFVAELTTRQGQTLALLRRFTVISGLLGAFSVVQFVTGERLIEFIQLPGLTANSTAGDLEARGIFLRPPATFTHPIEFGSVMTMALPLALHFALHDDHRRPWRRWAPVVGCSVGIVLALSRSSLVSAAVVLLILFPTWGPPLRRHAALALVTGATLAYVGVPGLIGTLRAMFTQIGEDPSAQSRTDSYALAFEFIGREPLLGRGFRTFLPAYRILDNQYLLILIELGVIGLLVVLTLLGTAIVLALRLRSSSPDEASRSLGVSLAAAISACGVSIALYDAFSFAAATGIMFVLLGATGTLHSGPEAVSRDEGDLVDQRVPTRSEGVAS